MVKIRAIHGFTLSADVDANVTGCHRHRSPTPEVRGLIRPHQQLLSHTWKLRCVNAEYESAGDEGEGSALPPAARPPGPQLSDGTGPEPA